MTTEGYGRTFVGDPNAPPRAPRPAKLVRQGSQAEEGKAPAMPAEPTGRSVQARFAVVNRDNAWRVLMTDPDGGESDLGPVAAQNADELLAAIGEKNPITGAWENVPERFARELMSGELPFPDYVLAKYKGNKALIARGAIYTDWLKGNATLDETVARGDRELIKQQIKEAPLFVWQGSATKTVAKMWSDLRDAGPIGAARRVAGETAGLAAFMTTAPAAAATGASIIAPLVAAQALPGVGPVSGAVVAGTLAKGLEAGALGLVFKQSYATEAGNAAADMLEKGFDEATVKNYAPMVGVVNGVLEVVGFHLLPAPYRRVVARKVLASEALKKVLTNAYVSYAKELGFEVAQEVAQERMNVYAETLAAETENRPDLTPTKEESLNRYAQVALQTLLGAGGLKAPGAVVESAAQTREKTATAAFEKRVVEREKQSAAKTPAAEPAPAATQEPGALVPPEPAVVSDTEAEAAAAVSQAVDNLDAGKISPDEAVAAIDAALEQPATGAEKLGADVQSLEVTGQTRMLEREQKAVRTRIDDLLVERKRFAALGTPTARLDAKISALMDTEQELGRLIDMRPKAAIEDSGWVVVPKNREMAIKPATLENIVAAGFKEGRKEVIQTRAKVIKQIAGENRLTNADIRFLLRDKNFGLMGDVQFRHFIEGHEAADGSKVPGFRDRAIDYATQKAKRENLIEVIQKRRLKNEANIRALHDLPAIDKMSADQLDQYLDIVSDYDVGSVALSPSRVQKLKGTVLDGARTYQEVLALAAERVKAHPKELLRAKASQFDYFKGDAALAESNPVYAFAVNQVQTELAIAGQVFDQFEKKNFELGARALKSRAGLVRRLVPSMPEVMTYLEATLTNSRGVDLPVLTPEEAEYAAFLQAFFTRARHYLEAHDGMESRFRDSYVPHMRKNVAEIIKDIKETGLKTALRDFYDGLFAAQKELMGPELAPDSAVVGLSKFFKFAQRRSGELDPSQNVIRVANSYARQFYQKQALDRAVPTVDSVVRAVLAAQVLPDDEARADWKALSAFIADYLGTKKGQTRVWAKPVPRGGIVDAGLHFFSSWVSLAYIGGNMVLQLTAPVGETLAMVPAIGPGNLAKGHARLWFSPQAKTLLSKYQSFTGKNGFADAFSNPGKSVDERGMSLLYAVLQSMRTHTMQVVLLGSVTPEEFYSGEISPERLAEIKLTAARWLDIHDMKSVLGSTAAGSALTKFRGWAIPILHSTTQDLAALGKTLATNGKTPLSTREKLELSRLVWTVSAVSAVGLYLSETDPDDDDSFTGALRKRILIEMMTLTQVFDPALVLSVGPVAGFVSRLGGTISQLVRLERYETGDREGELKALPALAKQMPFSAAVRNVILLGKDKE